MRSGNPEVIPIRNDLFLQIKDKLITKEFQEWLKIWESDQEKSTANSCCSICLEDYTGSSVVSQTHCFHYFHYECLVQWIKQAMP
jgi:hypothetical protein